MLDTVAIFSQHFFAAGELALVDELLQALSEWSPFGAIGDESPHIGRRERDVGFVVDVGTQPNFQCEIDGLTDVNFSLFAGNFDESEIEDALEFIKQADTHLFAAKEGGRNRVVG